MLKVLLVSHVQCVLQALFHRCDSNHTGSLSEYELKKAIQAAGNTINLNWTKS